MLDNQRMAMVEDAYVRNFQPLFVIGPSGVMKYEAQTGAPIPQTAHLA